MGSQLPVGPQAEIRLVKIETMQIVKYGRAAREGDAIDTTTFSRRTAQRGRLHKIKRLTGLRSIPDK